MALADDERELVVNLGTRFNAIVKVCESRVRHRFTLRLARRPVRPGTIPPVVTDLDGATEADYTGIDSDLKVRSQAASVDSSAGRCPIRCIGPEGAPSRDFRSAPLFGPGAGRLGGAPLRRTGLRPWSGQPRGGIHSEVASAADDQKLRHARYFASTTSCPREKSPAPQAQMIRELA